MSKYPLYNAHRERVIDTFEDFLAKQQERIVRTFKTADLEREQTRWETHEWVGRDGLELEENRK